MKYLSLQIGWFVPASQILDLEKSGAETLCISRVKRLQMEWATFCGHADVKNDDIENMILMKS